LAVTKLQAIMTSPASVPASLAAVCDNVLGALDRIAGASATSVLDQPASEPSPAVTSFIDFSAPETETTVAIVGQRGGGKSTALQYVCASLLHRSLDIVLPIIHPERFAHGDTLIGWVLSEIYNTADIVMPGSLDSTEVPFHGSTLRMRELLGLLRRQESLTNRAYLSTLSPHQLSPDEYAQDLATIPASGTQFLANWRLFVDNYLTIAQNSSQPDSARPALLVIPVDDADIKPGTLPVLLDDIRALTAHPRVATIFCADWENLRIGLAAQALNSGPQSLLPVVERGLMSENAILTQIDRVLVKSFPRQYRARILPLSPIERYHFKPIGATEDFGQLLDRFSTEGRLSSLSTLGQLFVLGDRIGSPSEIASLYAECLPDAPRDLEQLYWHISGLLGAQTAPVASLAAKAIVEFGVEQSPERLVESVSSPLNFTLQSGEVHAVSDFRRFYHHSRVGIGVNIVRLDDPVQSRVGVRTISLNEGSVDMHRLLRIEEIDAEDEAESAQLDLREASASYTQSVLLAHELYQEGESNRGVFIHGGTRGELRVPGGINWRGTTSVRVDNRPSDDCYWIVPAWEGFYDYWLYSECWNSYVNILIGLVRQDPKRSMGLPGLELSLLVHLELIVNIQRERRVPADVWNMTFSALDNFVEDVGSWAVEKERRLERFGRVLSEALHDSKQVPVTRNVDFSRWVAEYLPWCVDRAVTTEHLSHAIFAYREAALVAIDDLDGANLAAASALTRRIRSHHAEAWAASAVDVLRLLNAGAADSIEAERVVARQRSAEDVDRILSRLEEQGVPATVRETLALGGLTADLAKSLESMGFGSDALAVLQRLFPAKRQDEPSSKAALD